MPTLDNFVDEPIRNNVPTLLLSGEFDHVTPPRFADMVAENLDQTYAYTFPGIAHSPIDGGNCPPAILMDFLNDPTSVPDDACIAEMKLRFVTEPIATRLTTPEPPWLQLLLLLASILLMIAALVTWGLVALRRRGQTNQPDTDRAKWAAGIAAVLNLIFLAAFFASNPMEVIYGFPPLLQAAHWLLLLSILPTIAALYYTVQAWRDSYWKIAGRIFYTLVTIALVIFRKHAIRFALG